MTRTFRPDATFLSLTDALEFLRSRYGLELPLNIDLYSNSGLYLPHAAPRYLFRGECGQYPTTTAAIHRFDTYLSEEGIPLSAADLDRLRDLIPALSDRFTHSDYGVSAHDAIGLVQHYGLPTWIIDFTASLECAVCFAGAGLSSLGRICVMPFESFMQTLATINMTEHKWAVRPRRQEAVGVVMPDGMKDLKRFDVREALRLQWYEFTITEEERAFLRPKYDELVSLSDDPTAGFLRHHITEYVEAKGKFSLDLTEWLLARVPLAPRCYRIKELDYDVLEVVVNHEPPSALGTIDTTAEFVASRRYWSRCYPVSSWQQRMLDFKWPDPGRLIADPRTYHPSSQP